MKSILFGFVVIISVVVVFFWAMDVEVARQDYLRSVEQCKPIDGCLFDHNCNKYNKLIEKACE